MELTGISNQIIDFQKASFDQVFTGVTAMQEYSEKVMDDLLNQSPWVGEESKKSINDSVKIFKSMTEEYKKAVDQGFVELKKIVA